MSEELAAAVVGAMGPGQVDDLLSDAQDVLREQYSDAFSREVTITFSLCETRGGRAARSMTWHLKVDNESGYGHSRLEALHELRENIARTAQVPGVAQRVADVLREVDDDHWARDRAIRGAQEILDQERRNRR